MERKRTLELVAVESDTSRNEGRSDWGRYSYVTDPGSIDLVLRKADEADAHGDFYNLSGSYHGTVQALHYECPGEEHAIRNRVSLTFHEFLELGKPRRIQEIRRYEPILPDADQQILSQEKQ